ncbi:MAG TPA: hypothetical protein VMA75_00035 [Candidatus Paceibacterota bacterium]|nr:hypothetical protein [Candidatus Paceibacterota bacterium]
MKKRDVVVIVLSVAAVLLTSVPFALAQSHVVKSAGFDLPTAAAASPHAVVKENVFFLPPFAPSPNPGSVRVGDFTLPPAVMKTPKGKVQTCVFKPENNLDCGMAPIYGSIS